MAITLNGSTGIDTPAIETDSLVIPTQVINGITVGKGAGSVATNTAVGASSLQANTTGAFNTAVGYQAGYSNLTGGYNTFLGRKAGYATTSGENTFIGQGSGVSNTTGTLNSALGSDSFATNTTGSYNTALGNLALAFNTTASNNTAVGYQSLYSNTTGAATVAFGGVAGYSHTTGTYSTYVGYAAGIQTSTGTSNTFLGSEAGYYVSSGSKNTIIGRYTGNQGGLDIRTASNNIVLSDGDGNPRLRMDNNGQFYSLITGVGLYADYGCRAWVNFNGTGTVAIRGSGNISSISDNGTGDYTLNFSTAMPDVNYSVSGVCNLNIVGNFGQYISAPYAQAPTTSTFRILTQAYDGNKYDCYQVTLQFVR